MKLNTFRAPTIGMAMLLSSGVANAIECTKQEVVETFPEETEEMYSKSFGNDRKKMDELLGLYCGCADKKENELKENNDDVSKLYDLIEEECLSSHMEMEGIEMIQYIEKWRSWIIWAAKENPDFLITLQDDLQTIDEEEEEFLKGNLQFDYKSAYSLFIKIQEMKESYGGLMVDALMGVFKLGLPVLINAAESDKLEKESKT